MRGIISFACLIEADLEKFFFLSCHSQLYLSLASLYHYGQRQQKCILTADQDDSVRDHIVTFMPVAMVVLVRIQVGVSHGCN